MINQNVTAWRSAPSAATVERLVLRCLDALVGFAGGGHGLLLGGGSAANLPAVGAAVTQALHQPVKTRGPPVLYPSSAPHLPLAIATGFVDVGHIRARPPDADRRGPAAVLRVPIL